MNHVILDGDAEPDHDELLQRAQLGKQIELFWGTRMGEYLQVRATEYYNAGIEELKTVDPTDYRAVLNAQNKAWLGEQFKLWLSQAVQDGLGALPLLDEDHNAD